MKRALVIGLSLLTLMLGLVGIALLRANPLRLPAPDPALPIHLADGTTRPLSEVLQLARDGATFPEQPALITGGPDPALTPEENAEREQLMRDVAASVQAAVREQEGAVFHLAELARREGRLDEAEALYLSIPDDDPRWARAQRRLAWDVLAKGRGDSRRALPYAKAALAAEPLNGHNWHDFARICAGTLGVEMH